MKIGYADPPYIGQAKRHYGDHHDYGGEVATWRDQLRIDGVA